MLVLTGDYELLSSCALTWASYLACLDGFALWPPPTQQDGRSLHPLDSIKEASKVISNCDKNSIKVDLASLTLL